MTLEEAVDVVARRVIAYAAHDAIENDWDLWAEIGEADWIAVGNRVAHLTAKSDQAEYAEAYAFLQARAEDTA